MTVPRSGKAASAHIRQLGPERYHGLRIKVNGARLRARARRLCGAPPLGCPLPPPAPSRTGTFRGKGGTRYIFPRRTDPPRFRTIQACPRDLPCVLR